MNKTFARHPITADVLPWAVGDAVDAADKGIHASAVFMVHPGGFARLGQAAMSWTYPQDNLVKQMASAAVPASPTDGLPTIENLHFGYTISGDNVA